MQRTHSPIFQYARYQIQLNARIPEKIILANEQLFVQKKKKLHLPWFCRCVFCALPCTRSRGLHTRLRCATATTTTSLLLISFFHIWYFYFFLSFLRLVLRSQRAESHFTSPMNRNKLGISITVRVARRGVYAFIALARAASLRYNKTYT